VIARSQKRNIKVLKESIDDQRERERRERERGGGKEGES